MGSWERVWISERWLCGSESGSDRYSETLTPERETSLAVPQETAACETDGRETSHGHMDGDVWTPESCRPEEGVMLHTHLPQPLGCSVVQQLEANDGLKLVKLETNRLCSKPSRHQLLATQLHVSSFALHNNLVVMSTAS